MRLHERVNTKANEASDRRRIILMFRCSDIGGVGGDGNDADDGKMREETVSKRIAIR